MHAFILQDWTTIRGAVTTVTQGEDSWLDLTAYQDLVFWVDCRETSGTATPTITFQTSPTKDESLFTAIATTTTLAASANPTVVKATLSLAVVPVARYVRWQLGCSSTASTWDATFRVLVAANSPGM
jgi:hypothetical protein